MREQDYYESMARCCQSILNAKNEEEELVARQEIEEMLRTDFGYNDDVSINQFMSQLDKWVDQIESEEITLDEIMATVNNQLETQALQSTTDSIPAIPIAGAGISLGLGVLIGCFALRKKSLKNTRRM